MFSVQAIQKMNYNEQIAIIGETNRPPGGIQTILDFINHLAITADTHILEIGTATGFTAIELALKTPAQITAIDINPNSIKLAKQRAKAYQVEDRINFLEADATNLPFNNETFDAIFSGNIISYIPNRQQALNEYIRVLKNMGTLFATPMYYLETPANHFIAQVREVLKMPIPIDYEDKWLSFFTQPQLELYFSEKFKFDYIPDNKIEDYVKEILTTNQHYIKQYNLEEAALKLLMTQYEKNIYLFRDNLYKMGYTQLFFRKNRLPFDKALFTSRKVG